MFEEFDTWFSSEEASASSPSGVHRIALLLKRWLLGTHQGTGSDKSASITTSTNSPSGSIGTQLKGSWPALLPIAPACNAG